VVAAEQRIVERPHLVTFVGLGALLLLLVESERGRARLLWWIVPLTIAWANFHAGVFLAPVVLALYALGAELDRRPLAPRRTVLILLALTTLATCATPAGLELPKYLLWHTGLGATRIIEEFRRADLYDDPWFFVMLGACAVACLRRGRAVGMRRLLPALALAPLAFRSVRFVAEWAFVAAPLVAAGAGGLTAQRRLHRIALALATLLLVTRVATARIGRPLAIGLAPDVVPFDAIAFATAHELRARMYSDLDVGCYLLWEGWPRWQVFQDARLPAYPDDFHRALDRTPLAPAAFDALLQHYGVDAALLDEPDVNMRSGSFDPDKWALVFRSSDALVFARRLPKFSSLIAGFEIPLRPRFTFAAGTRFEAIHEEPPRSPVPPCEWDRRLAIALDGEADPDGALDVRAHALTRGCLAPADAAEVHYRLGARLHLAGRLDEAAREYDQALALAPDHASALINRGFARIKSDPERARADFTRALALAPDRADAREGLRRLPSR
jgi:tetratricopeptide (TPR) repeat protein